MLRIIVCTDWIIRLTNRCLQEVKALEAVLLGDVVDVAKVVGMPLPNGVVAGMRCPTTPAIADCTLIVVNTTPREQSYRLLTTAAAAVAAGGDTSRVEQWLAPFGVSLLQVSCPVA